MALEPNLFELSGDGLEVTYSKTSFAGVPQLKVRMGDNEIVASGGDFQIEQTALSSIVTLAVQIAHDGWTRSVSILVPKVHLDSDAETVEIESLAIESTYHSNIAGPEAVRGQVITYDNVISLTGTAKSVQF